MADDLRAWAAWTRAEGAAASAHELALPEPAAAAACCGRIIEATFSTDTVARRRAQPAWGERVVYADGSGAVRCVAAAAAGGGPDDLATIAGSGAGAGATVADVASLAVDGDSSVVAVAHTSGAIALYSGEYPPGPPRAVTVGGGGAGSVGADAPPPAAQIEWLTCESLVALSNDHSIRELRAATGEVASVLRTAPASPSTPLSAAAFAASPALGMVAAPTPDRSGLELHARDPATGRWAPPCLFAPHNGGRVAAVAWVAVAGAQQQQQPPSPPPPPPLPASDAAEASAAPPASPSAPLPPPPATAAASTLLVTVSDARALRVWNVVAPSAAGAAEAAAPTPTLVRDVVLPPSAAGAVAATHDAARCLLRFQGGCPSLALSATAAEEAGALPSVTVHRVDVDPSAQECCLVGRELCCVEAERLVFSPLGLGDATAASLRAAAAAAAGASLARARSGSAEVSPPPPPPPPPQDEQQQPPPPTPPTAEVVPPSAPATAATEADSPAPRSASGASGGASAGTGVSPSPAAPALPAVEEAAAAVAVPAPAAPAAAPQPLAAAADDDVGQTTPLPPPSFNGSSKEDDPMTKALSSLSDCLGKLQGAWYRGEPPPPPRPQHTTHTASPTPAPTAPTSPD